MQLAVDASGLSVEIGQSVRWVRHLEIGLPNEAFLARGADLEFAMADRLIGFRGSAGPVRFGALFKPYKDAIALAPWYGFRSLLS